MKSLNLKASSCVTFLLVNQAWKEINFSSPLYACYFSDEGMEKSFKVPCILHMDSIKGTHSGLKDLVQRYYGGF